MRRWLLTMPLPVPRFSMVAIDPAAVIAGPQSVDTDVTLADDSANFDGGNLTITYTAGLPGTAQDQLSFASGGGIVVAGLNVSFNGDAIGTISGGANGSDLVVSLTTTDANPAAVEALIEALQFQNSAAAPSGVRELSITVNDGDGGTSAAQTIGLHPYVDIIGSGR